MEEDQHGEGEGDKYGVHHPRVDWHSKDGHAESQFNIDEEDSKYGSHCSKGPAASVTEKDGFLAYTAMQSMFCMHCKDSVI